MSKQSLPQSTKSEDCWFFFLPLACLHFNCCLSGLNYLNSRCPDHWSHFHHTSSLCSLFRNIRMLLMACSTTSCTFVSVSSSHIILFLNYQPCCIAFCNLCTYYPIIPIGSIVEGNKDRSVVYCFHMQFIIHFFFTLFLLKISYSCPIPQIYGLHCWVREWRSDNLILATSLFTTCGGVKRREKRRSRRRGKEDHMICVFQSACSLQFAAA